jgi:hypothetical protein
MQSLIDCPNVAGVAMMADLNRKILHVTLLFDVSSKSNFLHIQRTQPENKKPVNQFVC